MPRVDALRQGMLGLMARAEGETAYFAHPCAWALFSFRYVENPPCRLPDVIERLDGGFEAETS